MLRLRSSVFITFCCLASIVIGEDAPKVNFTGSWRTDFGLMKLTQKNNQVTGYYIYNGEKSTISGTVRSRTLTFTYMESRTQGEGQFELSLDGKSFQGRWRPQGTTDWGKWNGVRVSTLAAKETIEGLWKTSYGMMRIVKSNPGFEGIYGSGGANTIHGKMEKEKFVFHYQEPTMKGEGWFQLSSDGERFSGRWREKGKSTWGSWTGERVHPVSGRAWLVVLEVNWENDLTQQEYSWGKMLRAFFERSDHIKVRHRFFTESTGLQQWCREIAYIPEPVVLSLSTHGSEKGIFARQKQLGATELASSLRYCTNLKLLHFSSCLIMKGKLSEDFLKALGRKTAFPISGYKTSVDWAASAIIEFMYFDYILMRGKSPEVAAEQMKKLLPFAGDKRVPGTTLAPAGFRILRPTN